MKKVLLSVFACQPKKGSEFSNGWNWAIGLANKGYEVHCLTLRTNRPFIEEVEAPANLHFHYVEMPFKLQAMHRWSQPTLYLHYIMWQRLAYKIAKRLHKKFKFDLAHHISWGSPQMGSFLYKLDIPFIFGPAGGGQKAPEAFKKYFLGHWASEIKREKVSDFLVKNNPACKKMLRNAHAVIASNQETVEFVKDIGAKNVSLSIDHALPDSFFPEKFTPKIPVPGTLKMLWVGRFMPRKGLLMTLDVMTRLKAYPNITLTIVGDGEMKEDIIKKINDDGLGDTVTMTGMIPYEQVREYYSSCDVFFFTSLRDSCPAQLTEAMAFGMPVVTINLHGQGFVVNDDTGLRCNCDTPEIAINELEKGIMDLYNNPAKVTKMSQAAFEFARKQTWAARIDELVKRHYPV
ncbi:glycosyltransferase family 4 protein [Mucilaginibacter sp.]|jgi:glycosyltransferase involved in cell wall biosynthesis|uniref:glycosyltransferase family 4 protein n=1 Tax=Mucilaginibacter sp. TaxID=1882438 RepID=UPI002C883C0F|nr:glycosyltransferase family 4 protein [Mucilaginibacter sp.]HTI61596.1 glycosyltransferase family 4 protein [Mucilaginibacter sp.]